MDLSILLSILCAMAWGIQSIFRKIAMRDIPLYTAILITLIINFLALVLLIGMGVGKGFPAFYDIPRSIYFYFMLAGFLNYFLGRTLSYSSFRFISVTQSTSISSIYPLISIVSAITVLGEKLAFHQLIGIGLTLCCGVVKSRIRCRTQNTLRYPRRGRRSTIYCVGVSIGRRCPIEERRWFSC